ncbi:hypothetical protein PMAYCL1PPCAC_32981, partial [Pristionchus mayeri]
SNATLVEFAKREFGANRALGSLYFSHTGLKITPMEEIFAVYVNSTSRELIQARVGRIFVHTLGIFLFE